jgi:hypothetical protein
LYRRYQHSALVTLPILALFAVSAVAYSVLVAIAGVR